MSTTAALDAPTLLLACMALAIIAVAAIIGVIATRREARRVTRIARVQSEGMRELMRTARMAETMAGIGVWHYDCTTGMQRWSDGLKRMFGVEGDEDFVEGDIETLLFSNGVDLLGLVRQQSERVEPFVMPFEIRGPDGMPRSIIFQACNLRNSDGRVQRTVAVVRDVTERWVTQAHAHSGPRETSVRELKAQGLASPSIADEIDPLTGFANRRRFMCDLDRMVIDARADALPLALVMFNIDACASICAAYGPGKIDAVVARVAAIAERQARANDLLGRVGDSEFGWVIPRANAGSVRIMAERMRQAVAHAGGSPDCPGVTISIGFAELRAADSPLTLFARADEALADAAQNGRNRVRAAA